MEALKAVGPLSYLVGILVAIVAGIFFPGSERIAAVVGALGILVGLLNITREETNSFLIASIAFITAAGHLGTVILNIFPFAVRAPAIMEYLVVFTAPAAAVVAIKSLYVLAKD